MITLLVFIGIVTADSEDFNTMRKMALEPYSEYHLYRGDLHVHTNYSADADSRQEINSVIQSAKGRLDFIAITDHDEHKEDVLTKDEWQQIVAVCQKQNCDGEFVVIPGYEWTSPDQHFKPGSKDYEHKILYFTNPPDDIFRFSNFPTPEILANAVSGAGGIGHTPHPRSFTVMDLKDQQIIVKHYERDYWDYGHAFSSTFSNAEVYPNGPLYQYDFDKVESDDIKEESVQISWEFEIQKALSMGYKLGFVATSDTHWPTIIPGQERCSVVFAKELTRKSILDALKVRRNYAEICPENIDVFFSISGHIVGDEFETTRNPCLILNIQSEREIHEVYIYKNNNKWITINKGDLSPFSSDFKEVSFTVEDNNFLSNSFYFVKIRLKGNNEYGTPFTVFTSPVWVNKRIE
ncbi:hypothetical protein SCALIN_C35_0036 [Candidatus Scalindua japonica]|uniref:Polymerase/histidinol phosphatase N-terminal domain-containing protein n=1 Tax=Candidatus Scalindua japonica TaxID=1284222 RepID=A0A286U396_9BACT|nr:hypothetical protein [Candidatus Scalindua japonica]GAX62597.1 hypothetical protein SCALIN_C35_0036 [Candidatus Scalindua japonica]